MLSLAACSPAVPCGTCSADGGPTEDDAGSIDAGHTDAGLPDAGPLDAGLTDAGVDAGVDVGVDAGVDAGTEAPVLQDFVTCALDIDCPAGLGRCLRSLPLHHAAPNGDLAVPASTVFPGLPAGNGICGEPCEQGANLCTSNSNLTTRFPFTCQVVYAAPAPYDAGIASNPVKMTEGVAFAAVCRPPLVDAKNCGGCATSAECNGGTCWELSARAPWLGQGALGACLISCGQSGECPRGFSCLQQAADGGAANVCVPLLDTCGTCSDRDGDGRGVGFCGPLDGQGRPSLSAVDCDDRDDTTYYSAPLSCGPVDHDCNGFTDATDMVGTDTYGAQHCSACNDACPNSMQSTVNGRTFACEGPVGARSCQSACVPGLFDCDSDPDCEVGPNTPGHQFAPDVDGDGFACNPVPGGSTCASVTACTAPPNTAPTRDYSATVSSCSAPATCPDAEDDEGTVFPGAAELCDGKDNDQNGAVDDGFDAGAQVCSDGTLPNGGSCGSAMLVTLGSGCTTTCGATADAGSGAGTWLCRGQGGVACTPNVSAPELLCNGIDDNCNGRVDEPAGDACGVANAPPGTIDSPCWQAARRDCNNVCVPAAPAAFQGNHDVPGDNFDADCDGSDLQANALYVWPDNPAAGTPNGTRAAPFRDLTSVLAFLPANGGPPDGGQLTVYVQTGAPPASPAMLNRTLELRPGVRIYGGFTGNASWVPPAPASTARSRICMPHGANRVGYDEMGSGHEAWVGLRCTAPDGPPVVLTNLEITVNGCGPGTPPASAGTFWGVSAYGGIFRDCDELIMRNVRLTANTPPPPPDGPTGQSGVNGAGGGQPLVSIAGGAGGPGGNIFGNNGSTAPPGSPPNTLGGMGGMSLGAAGAAPTSAGARGAPGAGQTGDFFVTQTPIVGQTIAYLRADGFVRHTQHAYYFGGGGSAGAFGYGAGAGANGLDTSSGIPIWRQGTPGGQGGGGGRGGSAGYPGGHTIGLVVVGSNLPRNGCSPTQHEVTPCGLDVVIEAGPGGPGGKGGSGGKGGAGGVAPAPLPIPSSPAGRGGTGGRGCGGGAGAGGRGGVSIGLVRDYGSFLQDQAPAWLTSTAAGPGMGGSGGAGGADGDDDGATCSNPDGGVTLPTGAAGGAGASIGTLQLPMFNCVEVRASDTDFFARTEWLLNLAGTTTQAQCTN